MTTSTENQDRDQIPFYVMDMTHHEDEGVRGFYYSIPLDENGNQVEYQEGQSIPMVGPYSTGAEAHSAAVQFINDAIIGYENELSITSDVSEEEVDFQGDLPIDENLEPNMLDVSEEEIDLEEVAADDMTPAERGMGSYWPTPRKTAEG